MSDPYAVRPPHGPDEVAAPYDPPPVPYSAWPVTAPYPAWPADAYPAWPGDAWHGSGWQPRLLPHAVPQPYHRVLRTRTYRWWKPLLGLLMFLVVFGVLTSVITLAGAGVEAAVDGVSFGTVIDRMSTQVTPLNLLTTNLALAALIPAAILAVLACHRLGPGWLVSVAGRLRWRLLLQLTGIALAVVIVCTFVAGFIPADGSADTSSIQTVTFAKWASIALIVLISTPLQAAGEEFAFRGYGQQLLGAWVRWPWVGAVVTSLLFATAHGTQNLALFTDRLVFGLVACWLVWRTGGLEASIALHAANNVVVFLVSAAFDQVDDALTVTDAPWSLVVLDLVQCLLFAALVERIVRRRQLQTRTLAA